MWKKRVNDIVTVDIMNYLQKYQSTNAVIIFQQTNNFETGLSGTVKVKMSSYVQVFNIT